MFILRRKIASLLILIIGCFSLFALENTIVEVDVQGNINVDSNLIKTALSLAPGDPLNTDEIAGSIKTLHNLNIFKNISIEDEKTNNGIKIIVKVEEFPIVDSFEIRGNKKLNDSKIEELIDLQKGKYWADYLEAKYNRIIRKQYSEKSYNFVKINYKKIFRNGNKIKLIIDIDEGERTRVKELVLHGNITMPSKKILRKLSTKKAGFFRTGKFQEEKFDEDLKKIVDFYNKKGYIDARVISYETEMMNNKDMKIDIYLYEGNQYHFGEVSVKGNKRFQKELILQNFRFKDDEIFDMEKFDKQLNAVRAMYYEEGYIYHDIQQDIVKTGDVVNINLTINENVRAKVRKINIVGNRRTKEKLIRRQLEIAPGDYFKQSRVVASQQNIYNMGLFEPDIGLDYNPINNNGDIDLTLNLNDKTSGSANGGIGYNTDNDVVGQFNLTHNNLFGNGWKTSFKTEFGGEYKSFELDFTNPYFFDTYTMAGFNIYHTVKDWSSFDYKLYTNGGSIRSGYPIPFLNRARFVLGYSFYQKKYRLYDNYDNASSSLQELDQLGWQNTSAVYTTISRDSRDNIYFPTTGSNFSLYTELAGGPFGGDFNYYKQIAEVSWFTPTFWKFVLRTKWRFAYAKEFGSSDSVPPDERFYLGGTGSNGVRGYPDRSIGPSDGGTRAIIFSSEYTFPIAQDNLTGLFFFDAGNAYHSLEEFNFWQMKKGAGIGIRIMTPLGLIGFDFAHNFEENKWEPHFQFGTPF